jgi:endonuclease G
MAFNTTAMTESFFMTNMSPQDPGFNRGIWKKLESQVRTWGYENRQIFVVTGPILTEFQDTIGQIPVPKYFYKVILDYQLPELKAIGLILENRPSHQPLIEFVLSVDSLEKMTNLDFFYELPDSLEHELESNSNADLWSWKTVTVLSTKSSKIESEFQCIALTNKNIQCTRTVSDSNSFCWQHEPENKDTMVWICGKSKIYHLANNHGSLKRCKSGVHKMTLREAENIGFRKCKE